MEKDSVIKRVSFILAILILYVAVVQVGLSTFWPDPEYNYLYRDCYATPDKAANETCLAEERMQQQQNDDLRESQHKIKFIIGTILSVLTVLAALFFTMSDSITYGLFGGSVINMLFTLRFVENRNMIGFIALLALLAIVIFFVARKSKAK